MIEEGGKAISNITEALKPQPLAIALIVINVLFLGMMVWMLMKVSDAQQATATRHDAMVTQLMKECILPADKRELGERP